MYNIIINCMPTICIPNITDEKVSIIDDLAQSKGLQKSVYCRMIIYEHIDEINQFKE